jgi:ABC-type nitrate/sulfonate/bicarbonate transport system substrate-binding protein
MVRFTKPLLACVLAVLALGGAACSEDRGGGGASSKSDSAGAKEGDDGVIRFTFAPDPVWRWLKDQGIKDEMEQKAKIKILDSSTWDEFGIYAGGHADVVSTGSFEVPVLEKETGVKSVVFGKYNVARAVIAVRADSPYKTLSDLKGKKITTFTAVSDALLWGALAKKSEDVEFKAKDGEYEFVLTDVQNMASLVAKGDAEACICLPDFAIKELKSGKLRILYDEKSDAEMFQEEYAQDHPGPAINVFVAREDWFKDHQKEAEFFLSVWERGVKEWQEHKDEIIAAYPQDFAATNKSDEQFISKFLDDHDWFVDSVYLDQKWIDTEKKVFDLLRETGGMEEDQEDPTFTRVGPASGS